MRIYKQKPKKCPNCKFTPVASISYGFPLWDEEMEEKVKAGRLVLGGCMHEIGAPMWKCSSCGMEMWKNYGEADPQINNEIGNG